MTVSDLENAIPNTSAGFLGATDSLTGVKYPTMYNYVQTTTPNSSIPDGCFEIRFDLKEYLPWNLHPDNIVSAEVEWVMRAVKDYTLPVLFLVGVPANFFNMAVFYKQSLRNRVNLCLFALSLADMLYLMQAMIYYGEQLFLRHTTGETFGPVVTFMANNNLAGFFGFHWVSLILSAVIACERCFCVFNPLKIQALLRTRTMAVIIIIVNIVMVGLFFVVAVRYRIGCAYDPISRATFRIGTLGEFYLTHKEFINYLEIFLYGVGIPGVVVTVVTATTILTTVKLRQIVTWRAETSSSLSAREVALTKMLIASSIFFIICITPIAVMRFNMLFFPESPRNHNLYLTGTWAQEILSYINSTFNFFVYYSMGSRYRETFWALFSKQHTMDSSKKVTTMTVKAAS